MARSSSKDNIQSVDQWVNRKIEKKIKAEKEFKIQNLIDEDASPPWLNNEFDDCCLALTGKPQHNLIHVFLFDPFF